MVHLSQLPDHLRDALVNQELPDYEETPWVPARPLAQSRVAIISTAGLHRREDSPFVAGAGDYRVIPDDADTDTLMMSHVSTNFDRTGFFQDVNTSFPIDRLHELVEDGFIGSVAARHYSFMGATPPAVMEPVARDLAGLLKQDHVDAVLLVPV
ncbi:MAG: glycine/sarcosine/betaine reductase selenoprotein B family protein [Alphaproteobacteria bacterium]|jgi:D-proline reductase (dithiol) PrdB|nr:glycine/sarcosine/betaine reductase selenoprotein B family protein [Alphaproteobacteria bacterium]